MKKLLFALIVVASVVPHAVNAKELKAILYCLHNACTQQAFVFHVPTPLKESPYTKIIATVTAYNTVAEQTDSTPCLAAGGLICGRKDVVACPRSIPLHRWVYIAGLGKFECMDRLNARYTSRFDISFDKDIAAARKWGVQKREVLLYTY